MYGQPLRASCDKLATAKSIEADVNTHSPYIGFRGATRAMGDTPAIRIRQRHLKIFILKRNDEQRKIVDNLATERNYALMGLERVALKTKMMSHCECMKLNRLLKKGGTGMEWVQCGTELKA